MTANDNGLTGIRAKPRPCREGLSRKMPAAVAALLTAPSVTEAAKVAGVSEATLWRWLRLLSFQKALKEAKDRVVTHTIARLSALSTNAVQALCKNLTCGNASVETRSAVAVLDGLRQMQDHQELEARLAKVERQLTEALAHQTGR
jgi:hypothetical protein